MMKKKTNDLRADDEDNNFVRNEDDRDLRSEHDHVEKQVKRSNLIEIFLRGTEVDDYIINHMYGREKFKGQDGDMNETILENTILDDFDVNETFTHQMKLLH